MASLGPSSTQKNIMLIGDKSVGKTNLIRVFDGQTFKDDTVSTLGVDFINAEITPSGHGESVKFCIWDTAGQDNVRALVNNFLKAAHAVMIVYDITEQPTFDNVPAWIQAIDDKCANMPPIILVGNKSDMAEEREVQMSAAQGLADNKNIFYIETSAKSGSNVQAAFQALVDRLWKKLNPQIENELVNAVPKSSKPVNPEPESR